MCPALFEVLTPGMHTDTFVREIGRRTGRAQEDKSQKMGFSEWEICSKPLGVETRPQGAWSLWRGSAAIKSCFHGQEIMQIRWGGVEVGTT